MMPRKKLGMVKLIEKKQWPWLKSMIKSFPDFYFNDCLTYMDITSEQFWDIINKNRPKHLWIKKNNLWKLKHTVY